MSGARREIFQADALAWLDAHPAPERASVITSLPDVSEMPGLGGLDAWRAWFVSAARRVIRWTPEDGVAIFYQSDVRIDGAVIDKGHLVSSAADDEGAHALWHKIVLRRPLGSISIGRPGYSHMIAIARRAPITPPARPGPEVIHAGRMTWSRAMGVDACRVACRFAIDHAGARVIVDPFCGRGTVLAVANDLGLDAIGVDVSARRCQAARAMRIAAYVDDGASDDGDARERALVRGARLFDAGAHFEAHEAWEEQWQRETDATHRALFQGLVQLAAALHKLFAIGSAEPAARLFSRGLAKLDACPERLCGMDVGAFRERIRAWSRGVEQGRADLGEVPRTGL